MSDSNDGFSRLYDELSEQHDDPMIRHLHRVIRFAVRVLAFLMVFVIIWGIGDVIYVLYERLMQPPFMLLNVNDIFQTFGAFMAVLIAIEIFINIRLYLGSGTLPIKLVIATALMAIARKVIVLDLDVTSPEHLFGLAATVLALGITYFLVERRFTIRLPQPNE